MYFTGHLTSQINPKEDNTAVTMYKNPGCRCCTKWADHLEENGFAVTEKPVRTLPAIKAENEVPYNLQSCHTAIIGDYVVVW